MTILESGNSDADRQPTADREHASTPKSGRFVSGNDAVQRGKAGIARLYFLMLMVVFSSVSAVVMTLVLA